MSSPFYIPAVVLVFALGTHAACFAQESTVEAAGIFRTSSTEQATEYQFTAVDHALLEEIQRGCFNYLWQEVGSPSGFVRDRKEAKVASLAGVGFQLSALPIGVERGWITREEGEKRGLQILRSLRNRDDNRRDGIYLHFVETDSGDIYRPFRNEASTVDHALLLAGAMPAATYFGGEIARHVDQMAAESNWRAFISPADGFLHMGWQPRNNVDMQGPGSFIKNTWYLASDEERIIYFLAVAGSNPEFTLKPRDYYRLQRTVKRHGNLPPFVVSWNGIPFNYFFSHCWIDYRSLAADRPEEFGIDAPRVDWFENSRRALLTHRARCLEVSDEFASFAPDRWGVSPCMGFNADGKPIYVLQMARPNLSNEDDWRDGTIAPYAAGSAIMFTPAESLAALRAYRNLPDERGELLVWRDPAKGGYGFADSFNLDQQRASDDNVAIDVGPMLLAIENVRTGLVWRLFMSHDLAKVAVRRLSLHPFDASSNDALK